MLYVLRNALANGRQLRVVGDSAYGGKSVTRRLPENTVCISRLLMNAALYDVAPPRPPVSKAVRAKKGRAWKAPTRWLRIPRGGARRP
jgi:hypothetical protein